MHRIGSRRRVLAHRLALGPSSRQRTSDGHFGWLVRCGICETRDHKPLAMNITARVNTRSEPRPWVRGSKLALRRAEVLDALGISEETFDRHVRPHLPVVRLGTVRLYPIEGIDRFLAQRATAPMDELADRAA